MFRYGNVCESHRTISHNFAELPLTYTLNQKICSFIHVLSAGRLQPCKSGNNLEIKITLPTISIP